MGISNPEERKPVALIAGPTASGKTALALSLAARLDVTVINADSAQVYAHLPVLSAQPSKEEMARCPHRLFGGTGLYLRTLLEGLAPIPEIDANVRAEVRAMATAEAQTALALEDGFMAAQLSANDDSRIKRALEVVRSTGRSISQWRSAKEGGIGEQVRLHPLILLPPRDWLHARCDARFEAMMEGGAVEEVRALLALNLPTDAPVLRAIGVPEIAAMLRGEIDQAEALARGQAATRQYAKRQYTWFRNQPPPDWPRWNEVVYDSDIGKIESLFQF
jgi:tRNA dimethylallyltransferase